MGGPFFLLLLSLLPARLSSAHLEQEVSVVGIQGGSVTLTCQISGTTSTIVHWYRLQDGKPPERFIYFSLTSDIVRYDKGFNNNKFQALKDEFNARKNILHIKNLDVSDTAMYYCAVWDN
uniref:Ig-like domain-containing protein n=1 Tax=Sarcophilus harrisii TaxID=9305 RepID=A0A7N4NZI7_SARHA